MNTFNKKSLCVALAAAGTLGAAGVAQAVNVSADGLGNVLIYPYYTVRNDVNGNPYNTLMSVVNTTSSTKAVKVRFREGRNSAEVLDFNVFLSPSDVWTASITPVSAGGDGPVVNPLADGGLLGAQITTSDKSCTIPSFYSNGVPQQIPFRTGAIADGDASIGRTSEGYFEVFEMATYVPDSVVAKGSLHVGGQPVSCAVVTDTTALDGQGPPTGGLFGGVIILSPAGGGAFSQPATALANFSTTNAYFNTGSTNPTYANAAPISNTIFGSRLYQTNWGATPGASTNAVSSVLMANAITNEYVLDAGSKSQTSWIATFPTKFSYVNPGSVAPFTSTFNSKTGACEAFFGIVFNREEGSPQVITNDDFSPRPGPVAGPSLCWEAQSIGFGGSNVFGSQNHVTIDTKFENGWATLGFNLPASGPGSGAPIHTLVSPATTTIIDLLGVAAPLTAQTATFFGLPVIGFSAETFQNDALTINGKTYLSTFGATFPHHATKRITP